MYGEVVSANFLDYSRHNLDNSEGQHVIRHFVRIGAARVLGIASMAGPLESGIVTMSAGLKARSLILTFALGRDCPEIGNSQSSWLDASTQDTAGAWRRAGEVEFSFGEPV